MSAHADQTPLLPGMDGAAPRTPIARESDPITSKDAARAITTSGKRDDQLKQVLALVRRYPGLTSLELAQRSNLDRYAIARRLPELEDDKRVFKGAPREAFIDGVRRKNAVTWWPGKPSEHTGSTINDLEQLVKKAEGQQ